MIEFGSKRYNFMSKIKIGGQPITIENYTKFLGVWIDSELNWEQHTSRLILKLKSRLGLLRCSKNLLNSLAMKVLYYAQIHSNLTYCLSMWGNMINKEKIQKIQDHCIATIDRWLPTAEIYREHKILTFNQMIHQETNKLWHKFHLNELPSPLMQNMRTDDHGTKLIKTHLYNTQNKAYLNVPCAKNSHYKNSFLASGLKNYNELPLPIRRCKNIATFSSKSKYHLLTLTDDQ